MNYPHAGKSDFRESGIVQRLRQSVSQLPVMNPHVLLACSGGKDSVALAFLLAQLKRLNLLTFTIVHIHHGQHERADIAADSVRAIGSALDVPVEVRYLDTARIDAHIGVGLEEAMRRERYLALADIGQQSGADCIALGHHQTDQAETILLHLMRGTGLDGLAGMQTWEARAIPWWESGSNLFETHLWRPMLNESLDEVTRVARQSGLPIVEDPTNADSAFRRNAVRLQVLPVLEEIAAGSTSAIARSASVIAKDAALLHDLTRAALSESVSEGGLLRNALVSHTQAMQLRVIRMWVRDRFPELELTSERIQAVADVARRNRGGSTVQIGSGVSVTLVSGILQFGFVRE